MTEESHPDDDSYIVRVKAVVMTRDESSGGWLAQEGGGLSRVGVCKVVPADLELLGRNGFLIFGERVKDKEVILQCFLKKDLVYTKATPTFHHWRVDNRKCGLSFQSPADARAFDRGVRKAIEDLTEGSTTSSSTLQNEAELGDDDVFTNATDSSSNSSQKREPSMQTLAPIGFSEPHHCILGHLYEQHRHSDRFYLEQTVPMFPCSRHVRFHEEEEEEIVRINPRERSWLTGYEDYRHATTATRAKPLRPDATDAYVHLAKSEPPKHDYTYSYPLSGDGHTPRNGKTGIGGGVVTGQPRALTAKWLPRRVEDSRERLRCVYCQNMFSPAENGRGRCQEAPDPVQTCIRRVSFMWCADSLLYHCMSDPEGDYSDPCSCDASEERFCLRWLALLGLSLLAPCMCCYAPLRACYHCGVACHCCGGKHKAAGQRRLFYCDPLRLDKTNPEESKIADL
ncbi:sprouty-related, EVH1 domain-containing protein 2-like [Sinocyclocheilus rhinocerous]|uniref:sprouty-related, EVH1 domain-containing protein 2-like n=1 Tax=Sinocyclocheilus rhinocerous TaxID=307959 RepID=UPI0007B9C513|nr:PREDICTED: sprouty-related, EVH1 domain-containing protein 2-like [Sinocyclocheilus rhinocerous]XP_016429868.1 PREDICTED: sprouty-related, EVH1 domain-containing protein 2-like [Sinocyclocheilus rhinocerous]